LYDVSPIDPIVFGGVALLLGTVGCWRARFPRCERRGLIRWSRCVFSRRPMGKRFAVCLAAVLCATGLSAPQRANPDRIERLREWLSAVSRHETGQQDDALFEVAAFSIGDVQTLMTDAQTLVAVIR